nr:TlpA family protein disulfide reductase [Desulfobulbaceae bacterium]
MPEKGRVISARARVILLVSFVLLVITGCDSRKEELLEFGGSAPDFATVDMSGNALKLSAMQGSPVILRFFVPNCKYCRADTKIFNEYYGKYSSKGLNIIYINTDPNPEEARKFVKDLGIIFPVILDHDKTIARLYRVKTVPQTIVLDPKHTIIGAILGGVSEAELDALLLQYINP